MSQSNLDRIVKSLQMHPGVAEGRGGEWKKIQPQTHTDPHRPTRTHRKTDMARPSKKRSDALPGAAGSEQKVLDPPGSRAIQTEWLIPRSHAGAWEREYQ